MDRLSGKLHSYEFNAYIQHNNLRPILNIKLNYERTERGTNFVGKSIIEVRVIIFYRKFESFNCWCAHVYAGACAHAYSRSMTGEYRSVCEYNQENILACYFVTGFTWKIKS